MINVDKFSNNVEGVVMSIICGILTIVFSVMVIIATKFPRIGLAVFILASFLQGYIIKPMYSFFTNMVGENLTYSNSGFVYSLIPITTFVGVLLCLAKVLKKFTIEKMPGTKAN